MQRILLVIDDFNELVGLETLFRRLGFDVLSLGRESLVAEAVLGFQADLAVATGRGRHVDGLNLAPKLRYGTSRPKLVVLLPQEKGQELGEHPGLSYADVDAVIETPFDPRVALKVVAKMLGQDEQPLLDKYAKIVSARLFEPSDLKIIKHALAPTPLLHVTDAGPVVRPGAGPGAGEWADPNNPQPRVKPMTARESRYAKFLDDKAEEDLPPLASADAMRDAKKKLEADEANATIDKVQQAAVLAREKREFVRAMIETAKPEPAVEIARDMTAGDASKAASDSKKS